MVEFHDLRESVEDRNSLKNTSLEITGREKGNPWQNIKSIMWSTHVK